MIDFILTEEQIQWQKRAREFAQREIRPVSIQYDRTGEYPRNILEKGYAAGLMNLLVPKQYGGQGVEHITSSLVTEELIWGCAGIGNMMTINSLGTGGIMLRGTEEQKAKFLPLTTRSIKQSAFCLTERGAGSDAGNLQTSARRDGDNYIINGQKCFITNGKYAAVLTVFATMDPAKKTKGICGFIVPTEGARGITVTKEEDKMGQRAMSVAEITFENVVVPKENLLGEEGEGFKTAMMTLDEGRINIATVGLGIARAAMEEAISYARQRHQFNQPIGQFQAIHFMLADMQCAVEAARLLIWKAARMMDHHQRCTVEAATAKFFATDVAMKVTTDALQIHGGYGYMRDRLLEKFMRDAKLTQIYEGTNQINRVVAGMGIVRG